MQDDVFVIADLDDFHTVHLPMVLRLRKLRVSNSEQKITAHWTRPHADELMERQNAAEIAPARHPPASPRPSPSPRAKEAVRARRTAPANRRKARRRPSRANMRRRRRTSRRTRAKTVMSKRTSLAAPTPWLSRSFSCWATHRTRCRQRLCSSRLACQTRPSGCPSSAASFQAAPR